MSGYSRSPKLLKGALVQFSSAMLLPVPNVILFQYNPATLSRTLEPFSTSGGKGEHAPKPEGEGAADRAQPHDPPETISLVLELDAADALEQPELHPVAVVSGVADRLAALELLLYAEDTGGGLAAAVGATLGSLAGGDTGKDLAKPEVPVALFVWGPGRIVPVRLTQFTVEEQAFNGLLYPIRAKVTVAFKVLTDEAIKDTKQKLSTMDELAIAAYKFTRTQKKVLAIANLANSVESIIGMLPI